jgi:uncharacterized protein
MLLQKEATDTKVNIKAYKAGEIKLNIGIFNQVVFLADGDKKDFDGAQDFEQLSFDELNRHLEVKPEVFIIGTGNKHQLLSPKITQQINAMGIAIEAMASRQACHTYQVLTYEQRRVYALIYP